ncbi:putative hydrolase [Thioalkalivibrio sulfidiphilus HL-EbGr7]|uniref:Putative hydrolase n=1 Tax=Thioalkalivibrio sulfidiphilus (strain HL-EbGR7) TaxID=396588 RepID=B8GP83_THISH|nr:putative hydrolase [Thioalkalivibrio sulfidiphilus HL-EbGr7]
MSAMSRNDDLPRSPALDWARISTVLLDMDGTLLDLHFDNYFWLEHVPRRLAQARGMDEAEAHAFVRERTAAVRGRLVWYCLDYWSRELDLDIVALKREVMHLIAVHQHAEAFLAALRESGRRVMLVTNAHRGSLDLKLERTGIGAHFHRLVSAHDLGRAKEEPGFWEALRVREGYAPGETLLVDDNLDVLRSARDFGIAHLRAVRRPDTRRSEVDTGEFVGIEDFRELEPPRK